MDIIQSKWSKRQSRIEDGVYFPSDEFIELCGQPGKGYRGDSRASVTTLMQSSPDGWTDLCELCSTQTESLMIIAGSTSWEGEGFIAVEHRPSGLLLWLLHLSNSEQFIKVSCENSVILATSDEYPFRFDWSIPIASPESLAVSQIHDA